MPNLGFYLTESADRYPDDAALRCDGVTTTYSQLADSVCRFAEFLVRQGNARRRRRSRSRSCPVAG